MGTHSERLQPVFSNCQTTQSTKEGTENYAAHLTVAVPNTQSKVVLANH